MHLHDELIAAEKKEPAELLEDTIESCWYTSSEALQEHRKSFILILERFGEDLPGNTVPKIKEVIKKIDGMMG